jgi:hypothetical protein
MPVAPDEPEVPVELPPLDRSEGADELADDELGELLPAIGDDLDASDVDRDEPDTDTNIDLPEIPGSAGEEFEAEGEIVFELSELVRIDRRAVDDGAVGDEVLGADDFDGSSEIQDHASLDRDDTLGMGRDDSDMVDETELPELDADEGLPDDEERWGTLAIVSTDVPLAAAPEAWPTRLLGAGNERCSALAVSDGVCAAASADLIWFDHALETPIRTAVDGTRISSLALVGREPKVALCVTGFGRLFRRERRASSAERLDHWRRAAEQIGAGAEGLELCQLGPDAPHSVLARLSSGQLLRSDDGGLVWRPIEAPLTAFAISASGAPLAALSHGGARLSLSADGGRSWEHLELRAPALTVASGEAPILAAAGHVVALVDAERGLVVSSDSGKTFTVVPGCGNVTAVAAGLCAERPRVWVSLYHEATDRTSIALVDVQRGEATVIGSLDASGALDPEGGGERARVERLCWDGTHLWAVGGFGAAVWWPPDGKLATAEDA